jgi:hypothetical protein
LGLAKSRVVMLVIVLAAALQTGAARGDSNLIVGLSDDSLMGSSAETIALARDLGVGAFRLSLNWQAGQTQLAPSERAGLDNAVAAASGARIVVAVHNDRGLPPLWPSARAEYCTYVRSVLERYPQINDVVIWNEPNLTYYWSPQFNDDGTSASPAAYQQLLAHCWDVLHAFRPGVNLIGPVVSLWGNDNPYAFSNVSHAPLTFIRKLGEAYRASGRTRPIIDTFGHHPHPIRADERPWTRHAGVYVSMGDWDKLMNVLSEAFEGTAQPIPGQGPTIWWLEVGYQTVIDEDKQHLYQPKENWRGPVPDFAGGERDFPPPREGTPAPDQATQLIDSVRLSYCQPHVEAFFNFLLRDEPSLSRWQSGVLWVDGTKKGSYEGFKGAIAEANADEVDCSRMKGGGPFISQSGERPRTNRGADSTRTAVGNWDEWGPRGALARPSRAGARSLPSGFFAEATPSKLEYSGPARGPFGFMILRSRLSVGGTPVRGKRITIVAGGAAYSALTNANGVATVKASPRLFVGSWRVHASFAGDPEVRPAAVDAQVRVVNTRARVAGADANGFFRVSYNGRKVKGRLRFRAPGLNLRAARLTGLGVGKRGRVAWFTGFNRSGKRFLAYAEDNALLGGRDRIRLWIGDNRIAAGKLRWGDVAIRTGRSSAGAKLHTSTYGRWYRTFPSKGRFSRGYR